MPCMTAPALTETQRTQQRRAIDRLRAAVGAGTVQVIIGKTGAIAFRNWTDSAGISDLCAYRQIANSPEVRRAVARAQVTSGNRVNPQAIAAGIHSHDGGKTWSQH